jgi:hypothetical protein
MERRLGLDRQVLDGDFRIALEARARRALRPPAFPSRAIESLETPGPRRRFVASSSSLCTPRSGRSVAFSIPDGLYDGRGGKPLSRLISSFSVWFSTCSPVRASFSLSFSLRCSARASLSLSLSARTRPISAIKLRTRLINSAGVIHSSESIEPGDTAGLNQAFLNAPFPPKNLLRYRKKTSSPTGC